MVSLSSLFLMVGVMVGCSKKSSGTYEVPDAISSSSPAKTDANALWEERGDKAKLEQALALYEQAYQSDPRDREVARRLVRGWYFLGDAHEVTDEDKTAAWDVAIAWGKKCLAINEGFATRVEAGESEEEAVSALGADDVPCMYWTASSLGKWGRMKGLATLLKHKPTVFAYISRVTELDTGYYYGGADRYWGAYYAALPSFAGQDLPRSVTHFDKSIEIAPSYLGTQVLKASYWAVKTQNKAEFESLLNAVLSADPTVRPQITPENKVEQAKARALLAEKDELFAD
jgi:tetratricopeptide (TPR) repeat protein